MKIVKRNREQVIKRWVKALRSGEYEQTQGELKDNYGFCCLGVLCDLAAKDGGAQWEHHGTGLFTYKDEEFALPKDISKFIFGPNKTKLRRKLIDMNDSGDHDFKSIANKIEKELL